MSKLASRWRGGGPGGGANSSALHLRQRSEAKQEAERERLRKNNLLCTSVIVIFGVCWLPLNLINFIMDVSAESLLCWRFHHAAHFACHVVAMTSNCYNPFLYGWLNDAFRWARNIYDSNIINSIMGRYMISLAMDTG